MKSIRPGRRHASILNQRFTVLAHHHGLFLGAIATPNSIWETVIGSLLGSSILLMIMVAIGGKEKLRVQALSFVVVCCVLILLPNDRGEQNSRFKLPLSQVASWLSDNLGTGEIRKSAKDEFVIYNSQSKLYTYHQGQKYSNKSKEEIEKLGVSQFVYQSNQLVSTTHLYRIFMDLLVFMIGWLGFFVSGFVYHRCNKTPEPIE